MLLSDIKNILSARVLTDESDAELSEKELNTAFGSDLMSDVLAFVNDQSLLLTGLINSQVIRTAEMMDINAICFVRGKAPTDDVTALAREKGITLLSTALTLYTASGKLYSAGLGGTEND